MEHQSGAIEWNNSGHTPVHFAFVRDVRTVGILHPHQPKSLTHKARNDYRACLHATWSEPEGSSHSGNIVCRGVAGGVASYLKVLDSPRIS